MHHSIKGVAWEPRTNAAGTALALPGNTHGAVTGQICDYFSQPALVEQISDLTGIALHHFLGTVIQVEPGHTFNGYHSAFPVAMHINLSVKPLPAWGLEPGDARILKLAGRRAPSPLGHGSRCLLVDGYFV